jgi:hypothetical protein
MALKCFSCVLQEHIQYDYYIRNDATLPRPHDTSPTGLLPSTFVLSRWFLPQKKGSDIPHSHGHRGVPHTARLLPSLVFSSGNHLYFLRPGALARLQDTRLYCWSRACGLPLPASSKPAPASSSSAPPMARDNEGVMTVPYFAPVSRLLAPRCPNRRSLRQPSPW